MLVSYLGLTKTKRIKTKLLLVRRRLKQRIRRIPVLCIAKINMYSHQTRVDEGQEVPRTNYSVQCIIINIEIMKIEYSATTTINSRYGG